MYACSTVSYLHRSFFTDVEASVMTSAMSTWLDRNAKDLRSASLSMLGDCNATCLLSIISMCTIILFSCSTKEYEQYFAHFPGESHHPSPAKTIFLSLRLISVLS